jgi:DNA-binding transcriptional ArsR family regulator
MPSIVKILRVAADPNRLRILLLLRSEELSVAELQEILTMGQSTISTHLSQLKQAGLVEDRRTGKSSLYKLSPVDGSPLHEILAQAKSEIPEAKSDQAAMRRVLRKRQDKMRSFFDSVAGRLGKDYVPGKSWKSMAEALLHLLPPMVIADLGAGEGAFALLLAQRAKKVIAVDTSAKMIEVGREQALRHGVVNVEYRLGDMEELPIDSTAVDSIWFSFRSRFITRYIPTAPSKKPPGY